MASARICPPVAPVGIARIASLDPLARKNSQARCGRALGPRRGRSLPASCDRREGAVMWSWPTGRSAFESFYAREGGHYHMAAPDRARGYS